MAERKPDLRKLARRQRWVIWLVLAGFLVHFLTPCVLVSSLRLPAFVLGAIGISYVLAYTLLVVGVVLLLTARGTHPSTVIVCGLLMVAPCANLLVLVLVNMSVSRTLGRAGLRVHLLGVEDADVERLLNPALCKFCSYDLTGNVSGYCPECGRPVEHPVPPLPGQLGDATLSTTDRAR